jgi:tetratricopeptide (TPR) repeat protein
VPFDREDTLKKAEKLLRQGRLDAAIAQYVRVVEEQPRDWNTANALGDLFVRAGQLERAAEQYSRIADHFTRDGFYSKAAALYKKILKIRPDDEGAQLQLADISARQGLMADAKAQLSAVAERRKARGDRQGADEIAVRLGSIDPADFEARLNAARVLADGGSTALAAERYRAIAADLREKNRETEALAALRQAVRLNPKDVGGRTQLARGYIAVGDTQSAQEFLDAETAANDPGLLVMLADAEFRSGRTEAGHEAVARALSLDSGIATHLADLASSLSKEHPEAAFACVDAVAEVAIRQEDFRGAASILQQYIAHSSSQVPALLKLVEVCVDGGLEDTMYETQAQLCDAYLSAGHASEARVIAEDLVAREPWEQSHIQRFRQALVMLKVSDPDSLIAERLNGQVPFIATDHFPGAETAPEPPGEIVMNPAVEPVHDAAIAAQTPKETLPTDVPSNQGDEEIDIDALQKLLQEVEGAEAPSGLMEVDLTGALQSIDSDETSGASAKSLDDVFAHARDTVAKQPAAGEAAEQLKLGKRCVETGRFDEAVTALAQAARSPRYRFEAASTLARMFRQRNDTAQAVEWMERAAEAPAPSAEEGRTLLYELGVTLEQSGENARALAVFMELLADAGSFRDAQDRVQRLSRVETGS